MIIPDNLKIGDLIGIVSTARAISLDELQPSINTLKNWGLKIRLGCNIFNSSNQFAGNDIERAFDLQQMIDNNDIKAILFARGGYVSVKIVDRINFSNLINNPKWLIGYSDITVFHSHLNTLGIASIHGTMPVNFKNNTSKAILSLHKRLFFSSNKIEFNDSNIDLNFSVTGEIIGGNLSILYSLIGSSSDLNTDNGKLRCHERKTKKGLNKHNIRSNLSKFLEEQDKLDEAMDTILTKREVIVKHVLKKVK